MSTLTSLLGLIKPTTAENVDIAVINANMDTLDAKYGGARVVANLAGRPGTPFVGQLIYQTDISANLFWSGTSWIQISVPYQRQASFGSVATIAAASSGSAAPSPAVTLTPPISGRLFWTAACWLRNTAAGSLGSVTIEPLLAGLVDTFTSANGIPVGSMSLLHTGYYDVVAGTAYVVTGKAATGAGTGTWAFDNVTVNFTMGVLMP